jgi:hypothetical protein
VESAHESIKADAKTKRATESTWDDVKEGAKKAYDDVRDSFQQACQWLSERIAPEGVTRVNLVEIPPLPWHTGLHCFPFYSNPIFLRFR